VDERQALLARIIKRIMKQLTRTGYLIEEQGVSCLAEADSDGALTPLQAAASVAAGASSSTGKSITRGSAA
jgi:hypothetical protein